MRHLTRRETLAWGCLTFGSVVCAKIWSEPLAEGPLVRTPSGPLQGLTSNGVDTFRGIPYARKPTGSLRFRAAEKVERWHTVQDATKFGSSAIQTGEPGIAHSEDCLYLNVWAPAKNTSVRGTSPMPVWVWVHGGGYTNGRSFDPMTDGAVFAREGIVCVTVAYRLGVFGFLDFESLLGSGYAGTANNGLGDVAMALDWVKENIASFGGDPHRVTVGGESAGAKLTDTLLSSPKASGLFQQAVSESGGAERVWTQSQAEGVGEGFGKIWRDGTGLDVKALLTADPELILKSQTKLLADWPKHFPLRPQVDREWLPKLPIESLRAGNSRSKRLLCGTNRDESALFLGPHPKRDPVAADLGNMPLANFDAVYEKYKQLYPDLTDEQRRIRAVTAEEYWVPSVRLCEAHAEAGGQVWMYLLDFTETTGPLAGYAYHVLDVGMVWDQPHAQVGNASQEATLGRQVHQAWCAFIRGEAPSAPALPPWPHFETSTRKTMVLDTESRVEERPNMAELRAWDNVL